MSQSEYESCLRQTLEITLQLFGEKDVPIWTIQFIAVWPALADGAVTISQAQMSYLLSGIDWRNPRESWRPTSVG